MNTTALLKASIDYERSKRKPETDLTNLLNHKEETLLLMVEAFEAKMFEYHTEIKIKERLLEEGEDLAEMVISNLNDSIAWLRDRTQSYIALRAIVLTAIAQVKK